MNASPLPPSPPPAGWRPQPFWRLLFTFVTGFALPVLACYGLVLVSALALQLASVGADRSSFDFPAGQGGSGPAVALIRVEGLILSTPSDPVSLSGVAAARTVVADIRRAAADQDVKAILLAVNSPGGGVVAADEIYHALKDLDKPIVVVMGDVAASGGFYISMAADWIIANPASLTGSIGVVSEFPTVAGLLEKVGVEFVVITSGPRKDFGSPYREMTEAEREYWQATVDEIYEGFVQIVAEGRGLSVDEVRPLADGGVFTGRQALGRRLVDQLGYEDDALRKAAELGGISGQPRIIEYPHRPSLLDLLTSVATRPGLLPSWTEVAGQFGHPRLSLRWIGQ